MKSTWNLTAAQGVAVSDTGRVIELATAIETSEHLIFDGLQAYQGSIQHELYHHQRKTELDAVIQGETMSEILQPRA